jgi:hypothetical protein
MESQSKFIFKKFRNNLGETSFFIFLFFFLYTIALCLEIVGDVLYNELHSTSEFITSLFKLPAIFFDFFLILWIFYSLKRTSNQLIKKKQLEKLKIVNLISWTLIIYILLCLFWLIYEFIYKISPKENRDKLWE